MLFEFEEGGSRKFYRIEREGTRVHLHWGRIGTDGMRKVRELPTEAEAIALYDAETYRRKTRGYLVVQNEAAPRDVGAARAAAERDLLAAAAPLTTAPRFMFVHRARAQFVWLERHDAEVRSALGEVGREAAAVPTAVAFADVRTAERAFERRTATLLREGFELEAFDAKPMPKAKPPKSIKSAAKPTAKPAKKSKAPFVGERWAFFGEFASWPSYHGGEPSDVAERRGAKIVHQVAEADVVVIGDRRGTGRSEAKKKADKLAAGGLRVLDEAAFRELVRIDLAGKKFTFIGGFDCSPAGLEDGVLARMVERAGGVVHPEVDAQLDYLVIGNHRGPRKIALSNVADKLIEGGAKLVKLDETAFLELVRIEKPAGDGTLDFAGFLSQLYGHVDQKKLGRALDMLREQRFELYTKIEDDHLIGVVRSQSDSSSVYASWVTHEGRFGCSQTSLEDCMGLQGTTCKHLLVLVVGLARTNQLPMQRALDWMRASHARGPVSNTTLTAETFIQYKGATAGEIDWRPTETIPEDFYAV